MFEMFGASFGATLAGCLTVVGVTSAAVYFFMHWRRSAKPEHVSFEQMQTIVTEEIMNVRELVTVRKPIKETLSFTEDKKIPWMNMHMPGSDRKLSLSYTGMIICGCDLEKIRFTQEGNHVRIIVPPSRILDRYIDVPSINIHYQDTGIFAKKISLEEQNALISTDLERQVQIAIQAGALEEADTNVRKMLNGIIERRGLNQSFDVEIVFQGRDNTKVLPARSDSYD